MFDSTSTAWSLVHTALIAYVNLVAERPNVFRFLVGSHFRDGPSAVELIDGGRPLSDFAVAVWAQVIGERGGNGADPEYVVDAALGAVALGVLRWLNTPAIGKDELVDQLATFLSGALSASAAARGVVLAPDEPLHPIDTAR